MNRERPTSAATSLKISFVVSQKNHPLLFAFIQKLAYGRSSANLRDLLEKALQQNSSRHDKRDDTAKVQQAPCPAPTTASAPRTVAISPTLENDDATPLPDAGSSSSPASGDAAAHSVLSTEDAELIRAMGEQF